MIALDGPPTSEFGCCGAAPEYGTGGLTWTPNDWQDASYDALDRLTGVAPVSGWQGYTGTYVYNAIGNLMGKTENGVTWVYACPNSGAGSVRPHAVSSLSNGWSYQYDANGNTTQPAVAAGTYVLAYNLENQMAGVSGISGEEVAAFLGRHAEWTGTAIECM